MRTFIILILLAFPEKQFFSQNTYFIQGTWKITKEIKISHNGYYCKLETSIHIKFLDQNSINFTIIDFDNYECIVELLNLPFMPNKDFAIMLANSYLKENILNEQDLNFDTYNLSYN